MKQKPVETKFVKEPEEETREFILQKNKKTKLGVIILIVFLTIIIIAIVTSNMFFTN